MKRFKGIYALMLAAGVIISGLHAQVMIASQTTTMDVDAKETSTSNIYIDKDRLCMETQSGDEHTVAVLRPGPVMYVMDLTRGTYMEITKQDMDRMKAMAKDAKSKMAEQQKQMEPQMEQMRKQMEEQMKNMTPEQRKAMEQYMPKGMMDMAQEPEKTVYKKVAGGVKAGQWTCDKYEGYEGAEKVEEVWATDPAKLGLNESDLKVFEQFGELFSSFGDEQDRNLFKIGSKEFEAEQGFPGVPVKTVNYSGGEVESTEEIVKIERKSGFDDALFQVRPNLKKTTMMEQMQKGMKDMQE